MAGSPPAPVPESSPHSYTQRKVEERLKYARELMKEHNLTPRSEIFFLLYENAAESALDVNDEAKRNSHEAKRYSHCARLHRYDQFIRGHLYLCEGLTSAERELEQKVLELKRLEYYFRYRDFLARELSIFKDIATTLQIDNYEKLQQYWTVIGGKVKADREVLDGRTGETGPDDLATLRAIWAAAGVLKLPRDRVECLVINCFERNTLVNASVRQLLRDGYWTELATNLYHDAKDLPMVFPPGMEEDIEHMSAVIRSLRARYFSIQFPEDENNPVTWAANDEAAQYRGVLRVRPDIEDKQIYKEIEKRAVRAAKKRGKRAERVKNATQGKGMAKQPSWLGDKIKTKEMEKEVGLEAQVSRKEKLERFYGKSKLLEDDMYQKFLNIPGLLCEWILHRDFDQESEE